MKTNVRFLILFLYTTKVTIPELLSHTIIKFEPFEATNILSLQHFNASNITFTNNVKILEKRQTHGQLSNVNNLLNQRIRGNAVPQCPCVIKPGTDKCIAYDSRYQAASIEEALVAFRDVTMDDDSLKYPTSGVINAELFACRTLECQTCAAILLSRIKQIGMVPQNLQVSIPLPRIIDSRNCRRLRFLKPFSVPNPPKASYYMKGMIDRGLRYAGIPERQRVIYPRQRNHFWSPVQPPPQPVIFSPPPIQPHQFQFPLFQPQPLPQYPIQQPWVPIFEFTDAIYNAKQGSSHQSQAGNWEHGETGTWEEVHDRGRKKVKRKADPPVLGTRYMISCVRHGEVDDDSMLALCSACWTWRKLPPDYFPPLINELVCSKENEGHCLSGWGKCRQKYRNFDVLRNVNGNWQPTTISSAMCCDCQIRAGTEIHSLVIGKRQH